MSALRRLRERAGLTLADVARATHVRATRVGWYEHAPSGDWLPAPLRKRLEVYYEALARRPGARVEQSGGTS